MFREAALVARRRPEGELLLLPAPRARLFTLLILFIVATTVLMLSLGTFGRSHHVRGMLVPSTGLLKVFPDRPMTVVQVLCREGDIVEAGAPLLSMREPRMHTDGDDVVARQLAILDRQFTMQREQMAAARKAHTARQQQLHQRIAGATQQRTEMRQQTEHESEYTASTTREFSRLESLLKRGLLSERVYEERRRAKLSSEARLRGSRRAVVELSAEIAALQAEQSALDAGFERDTLEREIELLALETRRLDILRQRETTVVAPRAGVVQAIHIAPGQLAATERAIVSLMPEDAELQAEMYVPGRAIGALVQDQRVYLNYDAFPFDRFGGYGATVSEITYAIAKPEELDTAAVLREPVYRVRAVLDDLQLSGSAGTFALQPGMSFATSLLSERRNLFSWLTAPLRRIVESYWHKTETNKGPQRIQP